MLFDKQIQQPSSAPKNLKGIDFSERAKVETIVDDLAKSVADPYAASLPLITSAELGDEKRYKAAHIKMLNTLDVLEKKPENCPEWMRNESFKAWMWGRVLLAADSMGEAKDVEQAKTAISRLLENKMTEKDSLAFYTWAWGYRAALNKTEYGLSEKHMMSDANQLRELYKKDIKNHDALSNALWAYVMNFSASANANDQKKYDEIKDEMKSLTGEQSVSGSLEKGLLRTEKSNDYPAWALAKIRYAAAVKGDKDLYQELDAVVTSSIEAAEKAGAKAEYALSVVDNQLAILVGKRLMLVPQQRL